MERIKTRLGWATAGALGIILVLSLARATVAGPLDPPGPVGSTMRTLGELVPAWDQALTSSGGCTSQRFTCVLGGAAVLDNETGLVWEKAPSATPRTWAQAIGDCQTLVLGDRLGWRLPANEELRSLADGTTGNLPAGHPFIGIPASGPTDLYWSSTTQVDDATRSEAVSFFAASGSAEVMKSAAFPLRWCVRGGKGIDG